MVTVKINSTQICLKILCDIFFKNIGLGKIIYFFCQLLNRVRIWRVFCPLFSLITSFEEDVIKGSVKLVLTHRVAKVFFKE